MGYAVLDAAVLVGWLGDGKSLGKDGRAGGEHAVRDVRLVAAFGDEHGRRLAHLGGGECCGRSAVGSVTRRGARGVAWRA